MCQIDMVAAGVDYERIILLSKGDPSAAEVLTALAVNYDEVLDIIEKRNIPHTTILENYWLTGNDMEALFISLTSDMPLNVIPLYA